MGSKTNMILGTSVVHFSDEPCSQRHEYTASKKLFTSCKNDSFEIGGISTDSGSQSVKAYKEVYGDRPCSLDTWHALKGDEAKHFKKIGSGTRKTEGILWHRTLYDKESKTYLPSNLLG